MEVNSDMPCCALVVSLDLPNLYLGTWGDDYTHESLILFLKKKKKVQHQLIMNFQSNLLFVFLLAMPTKLTCGKKNPTK